MLTGEVARRVRELVRQTCLGLEVRIYQRACLERSRAHSDVVPADAESGHADEATKLIRLLKGRSSRKVQQEFAHLRRRCWGRHFWARGYFCATAGRVTEEQITEEQIRAYIEGHDQEPPDKDFTVED